MTEKRLRGTLVTLGFFGKGAGENLEEQETSRTAEGTCGQDSVGFLVKLVHANFVGSVVVY